MTLTKLDNVQFPEIGPPAFSFSYHFCNDGSFDAASKYPQGWSSDNDFDDLGQFLIKGSFTISCWNFKDILTYRKRALSVPG